MQRNTTQQLTANLKTAITTAAVLGAIGGWATFAQQANVTNATPVTVAEVVVSSPAVSVSGSSAASSISAPTTTVSNNPVATQPTAVIAILRQS
ncbi:MAG: hypothetical protein WCP31_10830 [Chloroflexales bacterium]